jgi:hypothetical protein
MSGLIIWGFLVGFVLWESCFRIVQPLTNWLLPKIQNVFVLALGNILCLCFLVASVILLISLILIFLLTASSALNYQLHIGWNSAIGICFGSSIAGFFTLGLLRTVGRQKK